MNFKLFFKEKAIAILLLLFGIITIEIFLMAYNVGMFKNIYSTYNNGIIYDFNYYRIF